MEKITPPKKVNFNKVDANHSELVVEPCYPGYGVTIGNSLRRVLLASLDGAAIVGFKVEGADHEFTSIENVKEDIVDIVLNLKKVRLKIFDEIKEPLKLTLSASGETEVTAGDIDKNSQVEIVNTGQKIATLTDKKAKLEMELFVDQGRGYVTTEQREDEKTEIGVISIDAMFSPVVNVGFQIENTRVGEMTNWEKLIMNIETDGTISPEDAVEKATNILVDQFMPLTSKGLEYFEELMKQSEEQEEEEDESEDKDSKDETEQDEEIDEKVEELDDKKKKKRGRPKKNSK